MCPGIAVLGGGGAGGGAGGKGAKKGKGKKKGSKKKGKDAAKGGKKSAADSKKYPKCGTKSHPVDVATGRVFTLPVSDLDLPGLIEFSFERTYSSFATHLDFGLGPGWTHAFGWSIECRRRSVFVWNDNGVSVEFPALRVGDEIIGDWGWVLRREAWGYAVDADDGTWRLFSARVAGDRYLLTAIEDRNRNRISLTYEDGRLVEIVDTVGRQVVVVPASNGRIGSLEVRATPPGGGALVTLVAATYRYDDAGMLVAVTDADGFTSQYAYDAERRLVLDRDRAGLTFHFLYDDDGRCLESWGDYPGKADPSLSPTVPLVLADGTTPAKGVHHCRFSYFDDGYTEVADSTQISRFFSNDHGTLDKAVEGGVETATYDEHGRMLSEMDGNGGITLFERDPRGRITRITDGAGRTTVVTLDALGLPIRIVDASGNASVGERDARGNLLVLQDPSGAVTSYKYDDRGVATEVVAANGSRMLCEYDAHANMIACVLPDGATYRADFDAFGNVVRTVDPGGATTRRWYSNRGEMTAIEGPDGAVEQYQYDGEGNVVQFIDGNGSVSRFVLGGFHLLAEQHNPTGEVVRLLYNREGELVTAINGAGESHHITRDASGRIVAELSFDGRETRLVRDEGGRVTTVITANGETGYIYDATGMLVERTLPDGSSETFEYDVLDRLIQSQTATGTFRFGRDPVGRIIREEQTVEGLAVTIETDLDPMGDTIARRTSLGHEARFTRDAMRRIVRTDLGPGESVSSQYDALGNEVARTFGRGGTLRSAFDGLSRVVFRAAADAASAAADGEPEWMGRRTANSATFRYSLAGEITDLLDERVERTHYQYDPVGRLLAATNDDGVGEQFRYDDADNVYDSPREYAAGGRLTRHNDTEFVWNEAGQLVERRGVEREWRYQWTGADLLSRAESTDGIVVEYDYDPSARRVLKRRSQLDPQTGEVIARATTRYVWDQEVLVHEQTSGDTLRTFLFAETDHQPLAHHDGSRWVHYFNDQVGAPLHLLASDGQVVSDLRWRVWGVAVADGAPTPFRYQGQYYDDDTGLSYNHFRYYDPWSSVFLTPDPLGLDGSLNPYALGINTRSWIDPLGLDWNYRLRNNDTGKVYYYGRASDKDTPAGVASRHGRTKGSDGARMRGGGKDQLEQITPKKTGKNATRGIEESGITDGGTKTGTRSCGKKKGKVRGNKIAGSSNPKKKALHKKKADEHLANEGVTSATDLPTIGTPTVRK